MILKFRKLVTRIKTIFFLTLNICKKEFKYVPSFYFAKKNHFLRESPFQPADENKKFIKIERQNKM
jgi:hypothetical protein